MKQIESFDNEAYLSDLKNKMNDFLRKKYVKNAKIHIIADRSGGEIFGYTGYIEYDYENSDVA